MKKKLPVGIEDFEEFVTEDFYYVDKTLFIAELLRNWGKVNLFTRPRRFGKSLNMSMLRSFFEIGADASRFAGLRISRETELCEQYMGQFPVISISLKSVEGGDFSAARAALRRLIGNEALRFHELLNSPALLEDEKRAFQSLIRVEKGVFTMADEILVDSLRMLTQFLAKHYGRKVILLIDEYDVPLDKAFQAGYYDKMILLLRGLFGNVLKTNDYLHFAVLTGCLRISKESIFTGLNNLNVMTVSDPYFCDSFGFTEEEVKELLRYYDLEFAFETIREWYDGYQFGNVSIYCPWDVIKYVQILMRDQEAEPENYWANTSGNELVKRFIRRADKSTRDEIERLINGGSIQKSIKQEITYQEIDDSIENVWSVLLATGYLSQRGRVVGKRRELVIPNREVRELFIDLAEECFQESSRTDLPRIHRFCDAFPAGDAATVEHMLQEYLWDSISVRDTAVRRNMKENFYHGMILGLLQSKEDWLIQSNAELGQGYSDISIATSDKTGIIIEIKYAEDGRLEKACESALTQIEKKGYAAGLARKGMKHIIRYGIAFWEKECRVVRG